MSQTKTGSIVEVCVINTLNFLVGWVGNMVFLPWFGIHPSWLTALKIGLTFTVVFMFTNYAVRRWNA